MEFGRRFIYRIGVPTHDWRPTLTRFRRLSPAVALLGCGFAVAAFSLTFTHLAGSSGGPGFEDGPSFSARLKTPAGVAVDAGGNVFISDAGNNTIRMITPADDVTTLAGLAEFTGTQNGHGAQARFNSPAGLAMDAGNNVYVADSANHSIRRITPDGQVTTLAGLSGVSGFINNTGTAARFNNPRSITLASDGFLYVADTGNHAIRRVSLAGVVTTIAGTGSAGETNATGTAASFTAPGGITFNAFNGHLYVADTGNHVIRQITLPGAVVTTFAGTMNVAGVDPGIPGTLNQPTGICADAATGTLYATMAGSHEIREITTGGSVEPLAGLSYYPGPQDGTDAAARFNVPSAIAISGSTLYVADRDNHTVRTIELSPSANTVTTLAGRATFTGFTNGTGSDARFDSPAGMSYYPGPDTFAFVYVADVNNNAIRRVAVDGTVVTIAGGIWGYQEGASPRFRFPRGVAVDPSAAAAYIADTDNHVIRYMTYAGVTSLVAGQPTVAGSANGDALTTASFNSPRAVAFRYPYIYVADTGNHLVRRIDKLTGNVITLAGSGAPGDDDGNGTSASFGDLTGIAVDADDNVYVAESINYTIRKITPSGDVTTIAGGCCEGARDGTGTAARFGYPGPADVAVSGTTAYVADRSASLIRSITLPGAVVGTAGGRPYVYGTSPGTGDLSRFNFPTNIATGGGGVFIAEPHRIRRGEPELADRATIDSATGMTGATRQLDTTPQTATQWFWEVIRRPTGSTAALSSPVIRNPTFTPDIADLYVFRCTASSAAGKSISIVQLTASGAAVSLTSGYPGPKAPDVAFSHPVFAWDAYGTIAAGYTGTVHFTTSDPSATLPANYTFTSGDHGVKVFSVTLRTAGSQSVTVTDVANPLLTTTFNYTVQLLAPTSLVATGTATPSVGLTWAASPGATGYEVDRRSSDGGGWLPLGPSPTNAFTDNAVSADHAYIYRVRSTRAAFSPSAFGQPDAATTFVFTDDPLASGDAILAGHVSDLREAANALRAAAGAAPTVFTDTPLTAGTLIRAVHITQLRTAINGGRTTAGINAAAFTDNTITPAVTRVKALHITELRNGVK